jgi:hypothetical protein
MLQLWKTTVLEWNRQNSDKILNKEMFVSVLNGALKKFSLECSAVQDFQDCGSYLLNPENADFSKCLGKELTRYLIEASLMC